MDEAEPSGSRAPRGASVVVGSRQEDTVDIPEAHLSGVLDFRDWQTWYRITGDLETASKTPVVVLHGGPGASHNYTLRMARLSEQGWPVIHYDQLGAGLSTHLPDKGADFWTVDLFLEELDNLLAGLGVGDGYHVVGQSWGGMLGAEHAIRRPVGLRSLVIADSPASMDLWVSEANRLREDLPPEVQKVLLQHEEAETTDSPEYAEAEKVFYARHVCRIVPNPPEVQKVLLQHEEAETTDSPEYAEAEKVFYARHVCRIVPNPPEVAQTFDSIADDPTVYHTMNGPSEFHVVGTLRDWSVIDRVPSIAAPTLLVSGAYDEATPATMQPFMDGIPDVQWEIFTESSHMPHVEEEERFLSVVGNFLQSHEREETR